ncbi:MAG: hypothetical protein NUW37_13375 [Planctomycetes bacterium]|nr:hypothetical protein [Planctomycetota bacterium]
MRRNDPEPEEFEDPENEEELLHQDLWEELLEDDEIRRAHKSGDPVRLYNALRKNRNYFSPDVQDDVTDLLADRRGFVKPVAKAPALSTVNGVGTMLYGKSELDSRDGTYIATRYITFLYVPVWPLKQYLVRSHSSGSYEFFGEVPSASGVRIHKWTFFAILGFLFLSTLIGAIASGGSSDVHFVNGLDFPVRIEVADQTFEVPSQGRVTKNFPTEPMVVKVFGRSDALLEETPIEVPRWEDVVIYNVGGVAPVYREKVVYYANAAERLAADNNYDINANVTAFPGQRFLVLGADYVFKDAPDEVYTQANQQTKFIVNVEEGGWFSTYSYYYSVISNIEKAKEVLILVMNADPWNYSAMRTYLNLVRTESDTPLRTVFEELVQLAPSNVTVQISHQIQAYADDPKKTVETYRALMDEHPGDPNYEYIYSNVLHDNDKKQLLEKIAGEYPDYYLAHSALGDWYLARGNYQQAKSCFERSFEIDENEKTLIGDTYARTLFALGQANSALSFVRDLVTSEDAEFDHYLFASYLSLLRLGFGSLENIGEDSVYKKWIQDDSEESSWYDCYYRNLCSPGEVTIAEVQGLKGSSLDTRSIELMVYCGEDPDKMLDVAFKMDEAIISDLSTGHKLLVAAEAARTGATIVSDRFASQIFVLGINSTESLKKILDGSAEHIVRGLDPELRSAINFVRSRELADDDPRKQELIESALADDILHGVVTSAINNW